MKYRCLIADDNLIDRDLVYNYLKKITSIEVVATCTDGDEAASIIASNEVDIVFSDIDMPGLSGIGLKRSLEKSPIFVFITSHAEYAVESFNLDVVDFVVKPLNFDRLLKAADKAIEYFELKKLKKSGAELTVAGTDHFFIKENYNLTKIMFDEVLYIESLGDYSTIFTTRNKHVTLINLKSLARQLPDHTFRRVHKQYIVNLNQIVTITGSELILSESSVIPVSNVSRNEIIDLIVNSNILSRVSD